MMIGIFAKNLRQIKIKKSIEVKMMPMVSKLKERVKESKPASKLSDRVDRRTGGIQQARQKQAIAGIQSSAKTFDKEREEFIKELNTFGLYESPQEKKEKEDYLSSYSQLLKDLQRLRGDDRAKEAISDLELQKEELQKSMKQKQELRKQTQSELAQYGVGRDITREDLIEVKDEKGNVVRLEAPKQKAVLQTVTPYRGETRETRTQEYSPYVATLKDGKIVQEQVFSPVDKRYTWYRSDQRIKSKDIAPTTVLTYTDGSPDILNIKGTFSPKTTASRGLGWVDKSYNQFSKQVIDFDNLQKATSARYGIFDSRSNVIERPRDSKGRQQVSSWQTKGTFLQGFSDFRKGQRTQFSTPPEMSSYRKLTGLGAPSRTYRGGRLKQERYSNIGVTLDYGTTKANNRTVDVLKSIRY